MTRGQRMRAIALLSERFGPKATIIRTTSGSYWACHDLGFAHMSLGLEEFRTFDGLMAALTRYDRTERKQQAKSWIEAAFWAAAQGYDVREPATKLEYWITTGGTPGHERGRS